MKEPIEIIIEDRSDADGNYFQTSLKIDEKGLSYELNDIGPLVVKYAPTGGDSDYETWTTVERKHLDQLLAELIADHFKPTADFEGYLKSRNIPFDFTSY